MGLILKSGVGNDRAFDRAFLKEQFAIASQDAGYSTSFVWEEIGSTNDEAKKLFASPFTSERGVADDLESAVLWAFKQTAGRGRLGRTWDSPSGDGIYMSFVVSARGDISLITIAAGVSMCRILRTQGYEAQLKWPNDVLIGGKKVCGILSELIIGDDGRRYVVVGAGLNLSRTFDGELAETAVSLKNANRNSAFSKAVFSESIETPSGLAFSGREAIFGLSEREDLLQGMRLMIDSVGRTVRNYEQIDRALIVEMAKMHSATIGNEVEVHNVHDREGYLGVALDIELDGSLVVELPGGERRRVFAGEVTLKKRWDEERQNGKMGFKLGKRLK